MKHITPCFAAITMLLVGCAGHNHTLFVTKSNVGLDFDSKPPTLEVSVSRKEAVIAPVFEGGQTPPVLASFRPGAGTEGGFTSFFMGVDQTFAGGDAALAMSKLYNKPTATDKTEYDSAIRLNKLPDYANVFQRIPGPGKTRALIFGTDTSFGLKAAWSGVGGQIPDTVRLGFNRKEFAWAPLSSTPTNVNAQGRPNTAAVAIKMPSFLATIESKQTLGTNGGKVEGMQYFATGDSATYLALQQDVRAAMHARLDPNNTAFKSKFSSQGNRAIPAILFSMDTILTRYAQQGDQRAKAHLAELNNLAGLELPPTYRDQNIPIFRFDETDPNNLVLMVNQGGPLAVGTKLRDITSYFTYLEASQQHLAKAIQQIEAGKVVNLKDGLNGTPTPITAAIMPTITHALDLLKMQSAQVVEVLSSNGSVEPAYDYLIRKLNP